MAQKGYVKLYRSLLDWEWFDDIKVFRLFLYSLLKANHKDKTYKGINILRGQFTTSLELISRETGLSVQEIRTALKKLKSTNELTYTSTSKFTLITVINYDKYQSKEEENNKQNNNQSNKQATNEQQTNNKQSTTNKNEKNIKNEKNDKKYIAAEVVEEMTKIPYKEIVDYLNELTKSNYKHTSQKTKDLITARFNQGFTLEDFKYVIYVKTVEWVKDDKMNKFLRPETLFGNKFEGYRNQPMPNVTTKNIEVSEEDLSEWD